MSISTDPVIKAYLAVSAIIGTALGPMSPGSAYVLLHHYMGDVDGNVGAWGFARGGMGSITTALHRSLQAAGGEVRAGRGVEQILVTQRPRGRASGSRAARRFAPAASSRTWTSSAPS